MNKQIQPAESCTSLHLNPKKIDLIDMLEKARSDYKEGKTKVIKSLADLI